MSPAPLELVPIGYVRSPYRERRDAPRQGRLAPAIAEIVVRPKFHDGLYRIEEKQHLFILCWFDRSDRSRLRAIPPHDPVERGVFATRSPDRPNPVSLSLVDLVSVDAGVLTVRGLDALDGTPVIDIKPYAAEVDRPGEEHGEERENLNSY
ncbi:MAG TPA: tRNA (N6-threonylcarbamoyladenosine(37)-N6)-methyltransferase TrmO [Methanoregulaceae archaeon]|nr:tRNA (N6-threonylcarbamoyladenosine(37)-N6)-methyltransferase TrmO [Methanoregulaceae archaeon]HQJ87475.1 tRNA (N6-threonylcarbamoyladenosine(37)-N6)-methyltransferase TrmO [Methanoregulaceae archaeon]